MKLQFNETVLTGSWLLQNNQMHVDKTCKRIEWLIHYCLQLIAISPKNGAWETLYLNPDDGQYWERIYPDSELHGGGPPQLMRLTLDIAKQKYNF